MRAIDPMELMVESDFFRTIENSMQCLTEREYDILSRRFGLNGKNETLKNIGKRYGVTAPRIAQIEAKALRKIRLKISPEYVSELQVDLHLSDEQLEWQKRDKEFKEKYKKWF